MQGHSAFRATVVLLSAVVLGAALASGPSPAGAATILETATLGQSPLTLQGIGATFWIGARFTVAQQVQVDHIGANIQGAGTIFGAIVPLSGPGGLPTMPPSQIESYALAGTSFTIPSIPADVSVPLSAALARVPTASSSGWEPGTLTK